MKRADQQLLDAMATQDGEAVRQAITNGANPNLLLSEDIPVLVEAAATGNLSLTQTLLKSGSDPNFRTTFGITPLMLLAIVADGAVHLPIVKMLLEAGADRRPEIKTV